MILGLICARHHSQGLPGKNIRPMHGKPLIEYAIEKAFASGCDQVAVSTDIPRSVWSYAVPRIERPEELCGPDVAKWDVWRHAQAETGAEMVVDIDVTRPLTLPEDIDGCITRLLPSMDHGLDMVMAIAPADKHPSFDILQVQPWGVRPYVGDREYAARQHLPPAYYHGGVYAVSGQALARYGSFWTCLVKEYEIPPERALDIDTELDWRIVEMLMADRVAYAA